MKYLNSEAGYFVKIYHTKEGIKFRDDLFALSKHGHARFHVVKCAERYAIDGERLNDLLDSNALSFVKLNKDKENILLYDLENVIIGHATEFPMTDTVRQQLFNTSHEKTDTIITNARYLVFPIKETLENDLITISKNQNVNNGCEVTGEKLLDLMESHGLQAIPDKELQIIEFYNAKNELVACATAPHELF